MYIFLSRFTSVCHKSSVNTMHLPEEKGETFVTNFNISLHHFCSVVTQNLPKFSYTE